MGDTHTRSGIGVTGLLLVAFIVLKLVGVIGWSWWWVLSPLWISLLLVTLFLIILGVIIFAFNKWW